MLLETVGLTKSYGVTRALKGVSLSVDRGQVLGILGPNGSGKTTALSIILGAVRADSGSFSWFGKGSDLRNLRDVGALLEKPNLCHYLSAHQNLKLICAAKGIPNADEAVGRALHDVDMSRVQHKSFGTYSLGMKQRTALACAFLGEPKVLVLDEPINGLDPEGIAMVRERIERARDAGVAVIVASHILEEVEKVCTHVAILFAGESKSFGPVGAVIGHQDVYLVGAGDPARLLELCRSSNLCQACELKDVDVQVQLSPGQDVESLVKFLADNDMYIRRLQRQQNSLEKKFLQLLRESSEQKV